MHEVLNSSLLKHLGHQRGDHGIYHLALSHTWQTSKILQTMGENLEVHRQVKVLGAFANIPPQNPWHEGHLTSTCVFLLYLTNGSLSLKAVEWDWVTFGNGWLRMQRRRQFPWLYEHERDREVRRPGALDVPGRHQHLLHSQRSSFSVRPTDLRPCLHLVDLQRPQAQRNVQRFRAPSCLLHAQSQYTCICMGSWQPVIHTVKNTHDGSLFTLAYMKVQSHRPISHLRSLL